MVQVAHTIFAGPIADFTVIAGLTSSTTTWVIDDDSLPQVFVKVQRRLALLHEFGGLGELLSKAFWSLAWQ